MKRRLTLAIRLGAFGFTVLALLASTGCPTPPPLPPPLPKGSNPFPAYYSASFQDSNGVNSTGVLLKQQPNTPNKGGGMWVPGLQPWNKRVTSKGNPIWNNWSTGMTFQNPGDVGESDAYWDWYYVTQSQQTYTVGWQLPAGTFTRQKGSSSGFDCNCYGFAASTLIKAEYDAARHAAATTGSAGRRAALAQRADAHLR
jgi:hypothetical protein